MNKKKNVFIISFFVFLILFFSIMYFYNLNKKKHNHKYLININDLSEQFMDDYLEEIKKYDKPEEKENMLIVISSEKITNSYGAQNIIEAPNNQYILQYSSEEEKNAALEKLKKDKSIASVEENEIYTIDEVSYNSWGIKEMSIDYALNLFDVENLEDVTVAIIDTGCDLDLFNKYYGGKIIETYNVLEQSTTSMSDTNGHGTHVAGTIAEATPSNVKILPIKVSTDGKMYNSDIILAINYITYNNKADVINMSFGGYGKNEAQEQAIEAAKNKNIISVAAAGNDNKSKEHYPSSFDNTISIASVDEELKKSSFSNYGSKISFAAPGTSIKSIMGTDTEISKRNGNVDNDDDHETISGTSMATPHAASAVAILKSHNKSLTLDDVIDLLKQTSIDLGEKGWDEYYGYGLISFKDVQFCNKTYCDKYGVYFDWNEHIKKIELVELKFTEYNYYSSTNLMGSKVKVYYSDGTDKELSISDLPNLEILNYSPNDEGMQNVTIKTGSTVSIDIGVTNPSNYMSAWEYRILNDTDIEITGYKNNNLGLSKLYVPEMIDSKNVVAFADNVKLVEFSDFESYKYLYLPSKFNRIGNYSLANTKFKYIEGESEGIKIGAHALESSDIVTISIPLERIEDYGFKDCFELTNVDISGIVDRFGRGDVLIGEYAFYNCKKLSVVQKVNYDRVDVETIGAYAFYNCIALSKFDLDIISGIEEYAFYNTFKLRNVDMLGVDLIGKYAFYGSGIEEAKLGLIDVIEQHSFENCKNLKSFYITSGRVETRAFYNSGLEYISMGSEVTYIADDAFAYTPLKDGNGTLEDGKYKVVPFSGIIETSTNKLVVGFTNSNGASNSKIPEYITEIGDYAFTGNDNLRSIVIPSNITEIGKYAFKDCYKLENVYFMENEYIQFGDEAFVRSSEGEVKDSEMILYFYKDSVLKNYAIENNFKYRHYEPDEVIVSNVGAKYVALSRISSDELENMSVKLIYHEAEDREEVVPLYTSTNIALFSNHFGFSISYQDNDNHRFNYGDTYYILNAYNSLGYEINKQINVNIIKAIPNYTIPTGLTATIGNTLSQVGLPEHFEWMDNTQIINEVGEKVFKAKYIPDDVVNYSVVENIDILVDVSNVNDYIINKYEIDETNKYVDGININTTVDDFKKNIILNDDYTVFVDYKTVDGENLIYTGGKLKIYKGSDLVGEYTNIIRGDVNGDGKINYLDYVSVYNHIQKQKHPELDKHLLVNEYLVSADISKDNNVNYLDYVRIYNKIKELKGGSN